MIELRAKTLQANCAQSNCKRILLALGFSLNMILSMGVFAEAPVVDESDNFAMVEEQAAPPLPGSAKYEIRDNYPQRRSLEDDELPLAVDDGNKNPRELKLIDQIRTMQKELQELRGQIEVQAHDLKLLKEQQITYYKDFDSRLKNSVSSTAKMQDEPKLSNINPTIAPLPSKSKLFSKKAESFSIGSNNPADEQISYLAAYELVKNKRFDEALSAMQTFVIQHPKGGYTANAHYWLGELYMVKNKYSKAIEQFTVVLQEFPSSSKSAASNLKMGYALAASGKKSEAIVRLQQVVNNYPDTAAAQLAAVKLDSLQVS